MSRQRVSGLASLPRLQCDPSLAAPPTLRASEVLSLARPRPVGRDSVAKMTTTLLFILMCLLAHHPALAQRQWGAPIGSVRRSSRDDESRCVLRYRCMNPFVVVDNRMRFFALRSTGCILDTGYLYLVREDNFFA